MSPKPGKSTSEGIKCTQRKEKLQAGGGKARTSTALTVSEEQSKELAKLIDCISSSEEGQEAVKAACNEADEQQPGSGALLKELWELEREAFFKDQRGNGESMLHKYWII